MEEKKDNFKDKANKVLNDVKDDSSSFNKNDIESGKTMSIFAYVGLLALVPFIAEKDNKYVVYHAKQGMNLFILEFIIWMVIRIISTILTWRLWQITDLIESLFAICAFALSVLGIVNVCNGKAKELPIVNKIKFIK